MSAILGPFSGYILYDAVWSGTTPSTGYSVGDFAFTKPGKKIIYPATSATVTATLGASRKADLFAFPMHNIDAGSTKLSLTNSSGLNVQIQVPTQPTGPYGRLPLTTICDLRPLANAATRTSSVWNVVVTSNSVNVRVGAGMWLGTAVDFCFRPRLIRGHLYSNGTESNFFQEVNRIRSRTRRRSTRFSVPSLDAQRDQILDAIDSGEGSGLPSVLCPISTVNDGLYGSFGDDVSDVWVRPNYSPMDDLVFTEWNKGIPFLP